MTFSELKLVPPILRALERENYHTPTPIQQEAIPPVLAGRDLLGCAQTGTGKTAAFATPTLQRLMASNRPENRQDSRPGVRHATRPIRSLILTPTRELALQIHESFCAYGQYTGLRSCVIFGGVPQRPQENALRQGVDILVATPGRLNDLIGQGLVSLDQVEIFTLDEADRMLDMGFIHDVRKVIAKVPPVRQTLFFSATMPPEIVSLADSLLTNPVKISITPDRPTVEAIRQTLYFVDKVNKRHLLAHLLQDEEIESALVFTRTKHGADRVVKELDRAGISAQAIHGNKSQNARQAALGNFKNRTTRVLIATDIAARGIDIDDLSHVINYDLPDVPEQYVHRIGRTGRAGRGGIAISFCDIDEQKKELRDIERLCGFQIQRVEGHPWPMEVLTPTPKAELAAQRGGRRQMQPSQAPKAATPAMARTAAPARTAATARTAAAPAEPAKLPPQRPMQRSEMPVAQRQAATTSRRHSLQDRRVGRVVAAIDPIDPAVGQSGRDHAGSGFVEARRATESSGPSSVRQSGNGFSRSGQRLHGGQRPSGQRSADQGAGSQQPSRRPRNQRSDGSRSDGPRGDGQRGESGRPQGGERRNERQVQF